MKFPKFQSNKEININISKYLVDWNYKVSGPQLKVKNFLKLYWRNNVILEEFLIPGSRLRIDILNISKKIAIEVSPESTHGKYNKFLHGSVDGYKKMFKRDLDKIKYIEEQLKYKYIELVDEDIDNLSKELFLSKFNVYL